MNAPLRDERGRFIGGAPVIALRDDRGRFRRRGLVDTLQEFRASSDPSVRAWAYMLGRFDLFGIRRWFVEQWFRMRG